MPTYDYRCSACAHEFELFQSMSDKVKKKCPECSKLALERLIGTGAAVLFKGSGFYETDYRSQSYKKAAEADKKSTDSKANSKGDSKAESKPKKSDGSKSDAKPAKAAKKSGSKSGD
ncbi:MAG: zinc ribbon domain-containing protein [Planctomycetota bacterium]